MDRFRRNSKSSVKSQDSPSKSSTTSTTPVDLFQQVSDHQITAGMAKTSKQLENFLLEEAKFGLNVDSADEAYITPGKEKDPKIPALPQPSSGKAAEPKTDTPTKPNIVTPTPGAGQGSNAADKKEKPSAEDTNKVPTGQVKEGTSTGGDQLKDQQGGAGKKEENKDDLPLNFFANLIISCAAFGIAVTLVTFYLLKDVVPVRRLSNFGQHWDHFTTTLNTMPAFIHSMYEELIVPFKTRTMQLGTPTNISSNKPKIIVTQHKK